MTSTDELVREHEVIFAVLSTLERQVTEAQQTGLVPMEFLRNLVTFSRGFIDRCHHGKEEGCLFPCLQRHGEDGLIGVMLEEHERGRGLIRRIAEVLERYASGGASADDVLAPCREYVGLLQQHILKENTMVFPLGESIMADQDHQANQRCYERKEEEIGHEEHRRLQGLGDRLADERG